MSATASSIGHDTIAAIASPPGAGARAIVRVSGPLASSIVMRATGVDARELGARELRTVELDDGRGVQPALLVWMRGPRSLTGEDVAELHVPGNPALARAALRRVIDLGARPAQPGEFTRRAFLAGKLDLSRAEGVLVLVSATNEEERRAGSALLAGGLSRAVDAARATLDDLRALCEASLDFDETDTGHVPIDELRSLARAARATIEAAERSELARPGTTGLARVVLAGRPNAGKSSLFNALAARGAERRTPGALVHDVAGTTRDVLEAAWSPPSWSGVACTLVDAAGVEPGAVSLGEVDRAAEERARAARASAELVLWVADASGASSPAAVDLPPETPAVLVWSKLDLPGARAEPPEAWRAARRWRAWIGVSARTGRGLDALEGIVLRELGRERAGLSRELAARHVHALAEAREELDRGLAGLVDRADGGLALELVAEHWRGASAALDRIRGTTTPEDVLDRIFARFCLGK